MQAVAEFVEQGGHFVVGQQRRLAIHRRGEVAGQESHRQLELATQVAPAHPAIGHPGTATFALAGIEVEIEPGQGLTVATDTVGRRILVPGFHFRLRFNLDIEQLLCDTE